LTTYLQKGASAFAQIMLGPPILLSEKSTAVAAEAEQQILARI
jgi:hypothetical protein